MLKRISLGADFEHFVDDFPKSKLFKAVLSASVNIHFTTIAKMGMSSDDVIR